MLESKEKSTSRWAHQKSISLIQSSYFGR